MMVTTNWRTCSPSKTRHATFSTSKERNASGWKPQKVPLQQLRKSNFLSKSTPVLPLAPLEKTEQIIEITEHENKDHKNNKGINKLQESELFGKFKLVQTNRVLLEYYEQLQMFPEENPEDNRSIPEIIENFLIVYVDHQIFPKEKRQHLKEKIHKNELTKLSDIQAEIAKIKIELEDILATKFELYSDYIRYEKNKKVCVMATDSETICAASIEKIIQTLTEENEMSFTFLSTFDYYLKTPSEFVEAFSNHFQKTAFYVEDEGKAKCLFRIVNVFKKWIDINYEIIANDLAVINLIHDFSEQIVRPIHPTAATNLTTFLIHKVSLYSDMNEPDFQFNTKPPRPKLKKLKELPCNMKLTLNIIHPVELARQITLLDHRMFRTIHVHEFLHSNWIKSSKNEKAMNIVNIIGQFNKLSFWTVSQMLQTPILEERGKLLEMFIKMAYACYELNNFNSLMAIVSALKHPSIARLQQSWDLLPALAWDCWEEIIEICRIDNNFASLRQCTNKAKLPKIPYLGVYLSDLTFNEENPNFTQDNLVNVNKLKCIADILEKIRDTQTTPYCLQEVPLIQDFIISMEFIKEERWGKLSRRLESPRKRRSLDNLQPKADANKRTHAATIKEVKHPRPRIAKHQTMSAPYPNII